MTNSFFSRRNSIMKKIVLLLLVIILVSITTTSFAQTPGLAYIDDITFFFKWIFSSNGNWGGFVHDVCPFQIPEEGEVLLIQCFRTDTAITTEELNTVLENTRIYNKETDRFLAPIAMNWYRGSSDFDLFFYDDAEFQEDNYSFFCGDEEFTFEKSNAPDVNRKPKFGKGERPTMPPEGSFLEDEASKPYKLAESMMKEVDQGQMKLLDGEPQYGDKIAIYVFTAVDTAWKTTLNPRDHISDLIPSERLATNWDEADTLILIWEKTEIVGYYDSNREGRRAYTMVTVIDKNQHAMFPTYEAFVSEPPETIYIISPLQRGAKGDYEYEKAIEQISEQLKP